MKRVNISLSDENHLKIKEYQTKNKINSLDEVFNKIIQQLKIIK